MKPIDDLTKIKGITQEIQGVLNSNDIDNYVDLSKAEKIELEKILNEAGVSFDPKNLKTWQKEALLAHQRYMQEIEDATVEVENASQQATEKVKKTTEQVVEERKIAETTVEEDASAAAGKAQELEGKTTEKEIVVTHGNTENLVIMDLEDIVKRYNIGDMTRGILRDLLRGKTGGDVNGISVDEFRLVAKFADDDNPSYDRIQILDESKFANYIVIIKQKASEIIDLESGAREQKSKQEAEKKKIAGENFRKNKIEQNKTYTWDRLTQNFEGQKYANLGSSGEILDISVEDNNQTVRLLPTEDLNTFLVIPTNNQKVFKEFFEDNSQNKKDSRNQQFTITDETPGEKILVHFNELSIKPGSAYGLNFENMRVREKFNITRKAQQILSVAEAPTRPEALEKDDLTAETVEEVPLVDTIGEGKIPSRREPEEITFEAVPIAPSIAPIEEAPENPEEIQEGFDEESWKAVRLIVEKQSASIEMLRQELGITEKKAKKIIKLLEDLKIVGPSVPFQPREVLIASLDELEQRFGDGDSEQIDNDPISREKYEGYVNDPNSIPEDLLISIARKIKENKELSKNETAIFGFSGITLKVNALLIKFREEEKQKGQEEVENKQEAHEQNIQIIIEEINNKIIAEQTKDPKTPLSKEAMQKVFNQVVVEKINEELAGITNLSPENKRDITQFMYFEAMEAWQKSQPGPKPGMLKNFANWWLEDSKDKKGLNKASKLALSGTLIALASWAGIEGLDTVQHNNLASRTLSRGIMGPVIAMITSSEAVKNKISELWQRYNKFIVGAGAGAGLVAVATFISIPALFTALLAIGLKMGNKALFNIKLQELENKINYLESNKEEEAYEKLKRNNVEKNVNEFDAELFISKINSVENQQFFKEVEDRILSEKRKKAIWKAGREVVSGAISAGAGVATAVLHHTGAEKAIEDKVVGVGIAHKLQELRADATGWLSQKINNLFGGQKAPEGTATGDEATQSATQATKAPWDTNEVDENNEISKSGDTPEKGAEDYAKQYPNSPYDKKFLEKTTAGETATVTGKPITTESAPEKISGMDENAVVDKGLGVTHAFKEQIKANPQLGEELRKQIEYKGKVGTKDFYKALGQHFGYIDKNGDEVRVKWDGEDGMVAYKFEKVNGKYVVDEYHLKDGTWDKTETHGDGYGFEQKTDDKIDDKLYGDPRDYEYLHEHKAKVGGGLANGEKPTAGGEAPEKQEVELPSNSNDNTEEVITEPEQQEIDYDYKKELGDKYYASSEATWESVYGGKVNPVTGQLYKTEMVGPMGYNPDTGAPSPALITTPAGTGIVGYRREGLIDTDNFELDRPADIGLLARATGFKDSDYPEGTYKQIAENNREALSQIFVQDIQKEWHKGFKNAMAYSILNDKVAEVNSSRDLLALRARLFHNETSARPFDATPAFPKGERIDEYLTRAALEAAKTPGKLEEIEAKWDKVYADVLADDLGEKAHTIHTENINKIFPDYDDKDLGDSNHDLAVKEIKKEFDQVINKNDTAQSMLDTSVDKWDPRIQGVVYYEQKLNHLTGLRPLEHESTADYIKRCERWLEVHGESKKIALTDKEIKNYKIDKGEIKAKIKQMEEVGEKAVEARSLATRDLINKNMSEKDWNGIRNDHADKYLNVKKGKWERMSIAQHDTSYKIQELASRTGIEPRPGQFVEDYINEVKDKPLNRNQKIFK